MTKVVRIADEPVATMFKLFVQVIQKDVGQQWRERAALGHTLWGMLEATVDHHPGPEVLPDEAKQPQWDEGRSSHFHILFVREAGRSCYIAILTWLKMD